MLVGGPVEVTALEPAARAVGARYEIETNIVVVEVAAPGDRDSGDARTVAVWVLLEGAPDASDVTFEIQEPRFDEQTDSEARPAFLN